MSGSNAGEKKIITYEYDDSLDWLFGENLYENEPARVNKPNSVSTTFYSKGAHPHPGETLCTYYTYDPVYNAVQTETLPVTATQANDDVYKITYSYNANFMELISKAWYQKEDDTTPVTESYYYDGNEIDSRLSEVTNTLGHETNYSYLYTDGKVSKITETKNIENGKQSKSETIYTSATGYAYPEQVNTYVNNQPLTSYTSYDMLFGTPISTTDTKGRVTTYTYDDIGRVTKVEMPDVTSDGKVCEIEQNITYTPQYIITSADTKTNDAENSNLYTFKVESSTKYTVDSGTPVIYNKEIDYYNYNGDLLVKQSYDSTNLLANCRETQYHYDMLGQPIYEKDPAGNTMSASYDSWGDLAQIIDAHENSYYTVNDRKNRKITTYFKAKNSSTQEHIIEKTLDQWGRVTQIKTVPSGLIESLTYDLTGNVLTHTDPNGNTTEFSHDNAGQMTGVTDPLNQTTSYSHTILGKLQTVTNTDGSTSWTTTKTYDELGRLIDHKDPGNMTNTFAYNNAGLVQESTDPNGTQFDFTYDNQDRILNSSGTNAGTSSGYAYTYEASPYGIHKIQKDSAPAINYTYNTFGLVQSITHNGHQINYQYDTAGRISATGIDSGNYSLNKYYKDRLEKVQTDGSLTINNTAAANAVFSYNPDGSLESVTYPSNGSNIIKSSYVYNALGRLTSLTNTKNGTPISSYTYTYDNNGNITSITDLNGTVNYEYDTLNRLIKVTKNGTVEQQYTYDVRGNRASQTGVFPDITGDEVSLSYNLWNQLASVEIGTDTTSFEYGPTGLRVKKGSKNYIYDVNGNLKAEADAVNTITATYIWGGNRLLIKQLADGTQYYYLYNGHGDVVQITDSAGNIVNSYEYDEWGNISSQTEGIENEFKYASQTYDSETGLYYLRARYYDPATGRFISKDSNEGSIVNPLSLNLYTYCVNNPINYIDSTGHNPLYVAYIYASSVAASPDTQQDIIFISMDIAEDNYFAAGLDVVGAAIPGATGVGKAGTKLYGEARTAAHSLIERTGLFNKGAGKVETKVIGHFPDYINLSKDMGIKPFDIPINVWNKMTPAEQWAANTKFLDRAIAKNSEFVLATPIKEMKPGSYFEREVEYLFSKGYKLSSDGTKLIK